MIRRDRALAKTSTVSVTGNSIQVSRHIFKKSDHNLKHNSLQVNMAFPHPPGLLPTEIAFLCEMELVTVLPRQRLERLDLLGVSRPAPTQHHRSSI